jgi:SpoVK/Ycf46/Vps4 family AAA+-type ATPase
MFMIDRDGDFHFIPISTPEHVYQALPAGGYHVEETPTGMYFKPIPTVKETLVSLDTPVGRRVRREITEFFNPELTARLGSAGLKHRRGIILHGVQGTGKTSLVRAMFPIMVEHNAVMLLETNADHLEHSIIPAVRLTDPDRPIVLIWDEFEKNARYSRNELLQLLDGLASPDHLLTIGTTNYLNRIPRQLRFRPSRFSLVLEMPPLPSEARAVYVQRKFGMLDPDVARAVVDLTEGRPLDYLEEACKLALMGYDLDEIRDRIQDEPILSASDSDDEDGDDDSSDDDSDSEY